MATQAIEFTSSQNIKLAGRLELPEGKPQAWALFAHCFTCSKDSRAAIHIARALVEKGFGVLRFDFTGLGGSGGDFANTNFSSNVEDLVAAANWLRENHAAPSLLVGHSLGGAAVLAAAGKIPESKAVATLAAPFEPAHVVAQFGDKQEEIREAGQAEVCLGGRPFLIKSSFIDDLSQHQQAERIKNLRKALLVLHAPLDDVVSVNNATDIFITAKHPKSFVSLDNADHLLSNKDDARYAAEVIAAWAGRYVPTVAAPTPENINQGDSVQVVERGTGNFAVAISASGHSWLADEPIEVGGDNSGPSPYQLLSSALGACTAMTIRMYARHKELPLERVKVELHHSKVHAQDCAECENKTGKIDRIERTIWLEGDLTDEQRQRLLEIADKCPVHRTLHSEVLVESKLG